MPGKLKNVAVRLVLCIFIASAPCIFSVGLAPCIFTLGLAPRIFTVGLAPCIFTLGLAPVLETLLERLHFGILLAFFRFPHFQRGHGALHFHPGLDDSQFMVKKLFLWTANNISLRSRMPHTQSFAATWQIGLRFIDNNALHKDCLALQSKCEGTGKGRGHGPTRA